MPEVEEHNEQPIEFDFGNFDTNKKCMLLGMVRSKGIVSIGAKNAKMHTSSHYNYMRDDPEYVKAYELIREAAIDFVESKLMECINGVEVVKNEGSMLETTYRQPPNPTSIIFYLKTIAKKRGYVERQELTGAEGKDLSPTIIVNNQTDATRVDNI